MDLDLKYWGQSTLIKLATILQKPIKTDRAMTMKDLLHYARILIEVSIEDDIPETIGFKNEWGGIQHYEVKHEWKLVKCLKCSMYGHNSEDCKKGAGARVWRQKKGNNARQTQDEQVIPRRPGKEPLQQAIPMANAFQTLQPTTNLEPDSDDNQANNSSSSLSGRGDDSTRNGGGWSTPSY